MKLHLLFSAVLLFSLVRADAQTSASGLVGRSHDEQYGVGLITQPDAILTNNSFAAFLQTGPINYQNNFVGNVPGITSGDSFTVVWYGWFNVAADGRGDYTFGTESDDGSLIYLDLNNDGDFSDNGELIVDNNGDHGAQQRTATVDLQVDTVRIAVAFYEASGGEWMVARYKKGASLAFSALNAISGADARFAPGPPAMGASYAGLWLGQASLNEVKETATGTWSAAPAFAETVLLHVDSDGKAVLLKEATLMQTRPPAALAPVIVSQTALLANFDGITPRGGRRVGQRFSTATMPLPADSVPLTVSGPSAASPAMLSAAFNLPAAHPLNPFRHKYHPDLANGRVLGRSVLLSLPGTDSPSDHTITGTLNESITGLHKSTLEARGPITFTRVSTSGKLNQP